MSASCGGRNNNIYYYAFIFGGRISGERVEGASRQGAEWSDLPSVWLMMIRISLATVDLRLILYIAINLFGTFAQNKAVGACTFPARN